MWILSKKVSTTVLALTFIGFIALSLFLLSTSPQTIIDYIGVKNGYLVLLLLAFFSGVSPFTGGSYAVLMVTLVAGGVNPILLALTATIGDAIGGTTVFFLGRASRRLAPPGLINRFEKWLLHIHATRPKLIPIIMFVYGSIAPISNDVITIPMGIVNYSYAKVFIPLQSGTFLYNLIIAYGGSHLYMYIFNMFV